MSIDLRSDTVTKPSRNMRQAIAAAEVGDDVFGQDPTINILQSRVAELLGKEEGLFVASGTMGNQVAVNLHTRPGEEVILDRDAHIFYYEAGGPALLSGVMLHPLDSSHGILTASTIQAALRPPNIHFPPTSLICLENTLNRAGGRIFPLEEIAKIHRLARKHNLKVHLDGARLWNASVASGISLAEYSRYFDTVMVCFSKGLGAPVGSLLVGDRAAIEEARRYRKIYGGGMRQAGILGAAALYALEHNLPLLKQDHEKAISLAEAFNTLDYLSVDMESVQTNIVIITVTDQRLTAPRIAEALEKEGVLILALGVRMLRAVTHLDVNTADIKKAISIIKRINPR